MYPDRHSATPRLLISPFIRAALGCAALLAAASLRAELKPGDAFPSLAAAQLAGGTVPATTGKIVVVDFWASWCGPCKVSFPALGKVAADYAARDVVVVGVSVDEKPEDYARFMKKFAPSFPALHDARQTLVRAVQVPTMPTTYILDRQGRVRAVHTGFHGATSDRRLRAEIESLLAEKS
ncbi:MAG: TlpA family protein disulfide reductase [Opitutaceae bacterium]|nr:TlpA family protein disulfide reductase [Opitutaceae bacterium]